ncbi:hypothetical protein Dimus_025551 [Dionaea muscipula]
MTDDQENGQHPEEPKIWSELKLPELLSTDGVRRLHATIEKEWDPLWQSACQTAAGRALWKHVTHDPLAELLAGETHLRSFYEKIRKDCLNKAPQVSGVILAVRTLWFDSELEAAVNLFNTEGAQIILLGAGMDMRAYRLGYLKNSDVFEVDFAEVLQVKEHLLQLAAVDQDEKQKHTMTAKTLRRVAADLRDDNWPEKLQSSGFLPERNTVWILEGILYYLCDSDAMRVLQTIAQYSTLSPTVLLADFMNKSSKLSSSIYHFYSDWPDELLPSLGFSDVRLSQIGDPDAHFGLLHNPLNLFNKLRSLPRSIETHPDDGKPCCRLYLVKASRFPSRINL